MGFKHMQNSDSFLSVEITRTLITNISVDFTPIIFNDDSISDSNIILNNKKELVSS